MLYRSLYKLFEAQQTFWHEISSIDELNIEVWGSLSKEEQKRECINFDTPLPAEQSHKRCVLNEDRVSVISAWILRFCLSFQHDALLVSIIIAWIWNLCLIIQ